MGTINEQGWQMIGNVVLRCWPKGGTDDDGKERADKIDQLHTMLDNALMLAQELADGNDTGVGTFVSFDERIERERGHGKGCRKVEIDLRWF
jgi:hypothetical protein